MCYIRRNLAILLCLCLCLIAPCAALAEETALALTDTNDYEVTSAPVEAAPEEEAFALQPDAPQEAAAVSAPAEDAQPKGSGVKIDAAHFSPDLQDIAWEYDTNNDGWLSSEEIAAAKIIDCYGGGESQRSMKGIEYFTEATEILCRGLYERVDFRKNTKIRRLGFSDCYTSQNPFLLYDNSKLESLWFDCCDNMSKLDLSKCKNLKSLSLYGCDSLKKLDISHCPKLVQCVRKGKKTKSDDYLTYTYESCSLTVSSRVQLYSGPVTKVQITKGKKATMKVGGKLKLKAKLLPAGATSKLTWKSSNTKVATVSSSGVVKAKKAGTAKITVKTANGKRATITIAVKAKKGRLELSGYFGKSIEIAAKKLGVNTKKEWLNGFESWECAKKGVSISAYASRKKVTDIYLSEKGNYTIFGAYPGMKVETARKRIREAAGRAGYTVNDYNLGDARWLYFYDDNQKHPFTVEMGVGNGIVTSLLMRTPDE